MEAEFTKERRRKTINQAVIEHLYNMYDRDIKHGKLIVILGIQFLIAYQTLIYVLFTYKQILFTLECVYFIVMGFLLILFFKVRRFSDDYWWLILLSLPVPIIVLAQRIYSTYGDFQYPMYLTYFTLALFGAMAASVVYSREMPKVKKLLCLLGIGLVMTVGVLAVDSFRVEVFNYWEQVIESEDEDGADQVLAIQTVSLDATLAQGKGILVHKFTMEPESVELGVNRVAFAECWLEGEKRIRWPFSNKWSIVAPYYLCIKLKDTEKIKQEVRFFLEGRRGTFEQLTWDSKLLDLYYIPIKKPQQEYNLMVEMTILDSKGLQVQNPMVKLTAY